MEKYFLLMSLFFCLSRILSGQYCQKNVAKRGGLAINPDTKPKMFFSPTVFFRQVILVIRKFL